jgi:rubrerythrin
MAEPTQTDKNLKIAYVGEAKACLRLLAYAEKAEKEGYPQMAHLFRAISAAERVHALKHLRLMKEVESTEENLRKSFERETTVSENYYPGFIQTAEQEGNQAAVISFSHSRDAEGFHAKLYKNAIDHMLDERQASYFVCTVCGYVADGQAPEHCPVCNAPAEKFEQVD